ncbi:MAG: GNAT family N-acetyltransferase [Flavobacterium sp.]|nr:GNAT family N-acetyltransferase [Flavobacterium sp.]
MRRLEWDSDFFGYNIAEISDKDEIFDKSIEKYDLIYVKGIEDLDIKNFQCSFQENKIMYEKQLFFKEIDDTSIKNLFDTNYNIQDLYNLAFESGQHSRFLKDKKFGEANFKKLYKKWIDNSINKQFSDEIYVYVVNEKTVGFVTYKKNIEFAQIGLIAIDSNYRGRGIGKLLLSKVENSLSTEGVKKLRIPTQLENKNACFFYEKLGYIIVENIPIKHYWKINDTI